MDKLQFKQKNNRLCSDSLAPVITALLVPSYVLATCVWSYAVPPDAVHVTNVQPKVFLPNGSLVGSGHIMNKKARQITVAGNKKAGAKFVGLSRGKEIGLYGSTSPSSFQLYYRFPCTLTGGSLVAAFTREADAGCTPKPGIRVRSSNGGRGSQLPAPKAIYIAQASKNFLVAQGTREPLEYCSAVADSGKGWGFISTLDFFSAVDPCDRATQKCLEASSGSDCSVVSFGEWNYDDQNLIVSAQCNSNPPLRRDNIKGSEVGSAMSELEEQAKAQKLTDCTLDVYYPDDVFVSPSPGNNEETIVKIDDTGNGIKTTAVLGDLLVKSAKDPEGVPVKEGQEYFYSSIYQDNRPPQNINLTEVRNLPEIRDFLNCDNWLPSGLRCNSSLPPESPVPQDIADQIADQMGEFRQALGLRPPVANDDTATVLSGQSVNIKVLANDSDPDNDTLAVTNIKQGRSNEKVKLSSDGTITYAASELAGLENFTYTISDGKSGTATATVAVTVKEAPPPPRPPVANDDTATVSYGANQPVTINVLANDSDPDGDKLTVTNVTQGQNGSVEFKPDGTLTYSVENDSDTDSFAYTISDGKGGTATATVTVTITYGDEQNQQGPSPIK